VAALSYEDTIAKQLIGLIYMRPEVMATAISVLTRDDLLPDPARPIFRAMKEAYQGASFDFAYVQSSLALIPQGWDYLTESQQLILNPFSVDDETIGEWCGVLAERGYKQVCRQILKAAVQRLNQEDEPLDEAIADLLSALSSFREEGSFRWRGMAELVEAAQGIVSSWSDPAAPLSGVRTGFPSLDKYLHSLPNGEVCIVAARSQHGKTAFVMQILANVARFYLAQGLKMCVGFFSAETSGELLTIRLACALSGVDQNRLKRGEATPEEWDRFEQAMTLIKSLPIYIDASPNPTTDNMLIRSLALTNVTINGERYRVGLVAFDFMELGGDEHPDEQLRLTKIMRGLKTLAKTLNVPVIALSQLKREVDERQDKRPRGSDVRWSDMMRNLCYQMIFIYRESVYKARTSGYRPELDPTRERAEIIIDKNKDGQVGTVILGFVDKFTRFYDPKDTYSDPLSPYYLQGVQGGQLYMAGQFSPSGFGGYVPTSPAPASPDLGPEDDQPNLLDDMEF
jgi:replicative DNA helicase